MSGKSNWSFEFPWGKKHPIKRIEELNKRKDTIKKQSQLLEDRFKERMIDFDRQIELINSEILIAEKCEQDRIRRKSKEIVYRLSNIGIDVFDKIKGVEIDEKLYKELLELYIKHKEELEDQEDQENNEKNEKDLNLSDETEVELVNIEDIENMIKEDKE